MLKYFLYPFSLLYSLIVKIRNFCYDNGIFRSREFDIPVICVGNITVGGTGKTPHVAYLIHLLKDKFKIAMLSRGYMRKTKGFLLSDIHSKVRDIGDEPRQIKLNYPDIVVAVDEKRVRGVENIRKETETDVVILDDAYQHRQIKPGLSVLLVDFNRPIYDDHILPMGRLRESAAEKRRASIIIVTKCPHDLKPIDRRIIAQNLNLFPFQSIYFTTVKYSHPVAVFPAHHKKLNEMDKLKDTSVLLVTGIANAGNFKHYISHFSKETVHLNFSDHHNYNNRDIQKIFTTFESIQNSKKVIITTEKDAVRLMEMDTMDENLKKHLFYIPIVVEFLFDEQENFNKQIIDYVRNDQTNSKFYSTKRQL